MVGGSVLHGNGSLRPFKQSGHFAKGALGFDHPPVDPNDPISIARAMRFSDLVVLVGDPALEPPISYGIEIREPQLVRKDGSRDRLPYGTVSGRHFSLLLVLARPLWFGNPRDIGLIEMAQLPFMDLDMGDALELKAAMYVGDRADVACVTDHVFARLEGGAPFVAGRVDDPAVMLQVDDEDGHAVTAVRPRSDGGFRFRLPPGRYHLEVHTVSGVAQDRWIDVETEGLELEPIRIASDGRVRLPRGGTMRLIFQGLGDTPDPVLGSDLLRLRYGEEPYPSATSANHVTLVGTPRDPESVKLPPGRYQVLATRGPEFSVTRAEVEVIAGESVALAIEPPVRVLETPGWVAADLHVHAAPSFDSALPWERQIGAFYAQGGEVLLASDHHVITDPRPAIAAAGLEGRVAGIVGTEITGTAETALVPYTIGHANAFPLTPKPLQYRRGGPPSAGLRLRQVMASLRAEHPGVLVQLNHPRSAPGESSPSPFYYLDNMAVAGRPFRASVPLSWGKNRVLIERDPVSGLRDIDFDVIEVWNGASEQRYRWTRAAWFSLLLQGELRTGTANSDSHRLGELVALPRSYVRVPDDRIDPFDRDAFVDAVRRGRVVGTSGPVVDVFLGEAGVGD